MIETGNTSIILIHDLVDLRDRKQQELKFYNDQLGELKSRMYLIKKEIDLTSEIITLIEREKLLDLKNLLK